MSDAIDVTQSQWIGPGTLAVEQALRLSPVVLAYIGDAVYELYVRSSLLFPAKPIDRYHRQVVAQVCAAGQVQQLLNCFSYLDESEKEIVRKGRNAVSGANRKSDPHQYRKATGLEALVGYLYLTNPDRLQELWQYLDFSENTTGSTD